MDVEDDGLLRVDEVERELRVVLVTLHAVGKPHRDEPRSAALGDELFDREPAEAPGERGVLAAADAEHEALRSRRAQVRLQEVDPGAHLLGRVDDGADIEFGDDSRLHALACPRRYRRRVSGGETRLAASAAAPERADRLPLASRLGGVVAHRREGPVEVSVSTMVLRPRDRRGRAAARARRRALAGDPARRVRDRARPAARAGRARLGGARRLPRPPVGVRSRDAVLPRGQRDRLPRDPRPSAEPCGDRMDHLPRGGVGIGALVAVDLPSAAFIGIALTSTALGTILPVLRDSGELRTPFGIVGDRARRRRRVRAAARDLALPRRTLAARRDDRAPAVRAHRRHRHLARGEGRRRAACTARSPRPCIPAGSSRSGSWSSCSSHSSRSASCSTSTCCSARSPPA